MQLGVATCGKLVAHNAAMYSPALRALYPQTVLASAVFGFSISDGEWDSFCSSQLTERGIHAKAVLPQSQQRLAAKPAVAKWEKKRKKLALQAVQRKPAAKLVFEVFRKPAHSRVVKRTPFNRKRIMG